MVSGPVSSPPAPRERLRKASAASRVFLAKGSSVSPMAVTMTLRVERSMSWTPSPVSRATSACDSEGWEMFSFCAAVPKCLFSAMVTNVRSWASVGRYSLFDISIRVTYRRPECDLGP